MKSATYFLTMKTKNHQPFLFVCIAIICITSLSVLIKEGMFMDAVLYTDVSRNMAEGYGSFWSPQFSKMNVAAQDAFLEHPPLAFGIQSIFFKIFGDSIYTERIYVMFCLLAAIFLLYQIWKTVIDKTYSQSFWILIFLWFTMPIVFWTYQNNMQENTMVIFVLCAVLFYLNYQKNQKYSWLTLSGISIFLASFTKGVPGLFPLALPFLYFLIMQRMHLMKMLVESFLLLIIVLSIYSILFVLPASKDAMHVYLFDRLLYRVNENPTVSSRFYILGSLFFQTLVPLAITCISILFLRRKNKFMLSNDVKKFSCFFILLGTAGSVPLMLTLVQKTFYFTPSLPFFAMGFALLLAESFSPLILKVSNKVMFRFRMISIVILCGSIFYVFMQIGKYSRTKEIILDTKTISEIIPDGGTASMDKSFWNDWVFQTYLMRYAKVSVDPHELHTYFILPKNSKSQIPEEYKKINLQTFKYDVYISENKKP